MHAMSNVKQKNHINPKTKTYTSIKIDNKTPMPRETKNTKKLKKKPRSQKKSPCMSKS